MTFLPIHNSNLVGSKLADRLFTDTLNSLFSDANLPNTSSASIVDWAPAVDVSESDSSYTVKADIPGISPKEIELFFEGKTLTIKGSRESEDETEENGTLRKERSEGNFERRFSFSKEINSDAITAKGEHGVLVIEIPKKEAEAVKKIEIN